MQNALADEIKMLTSMTIPMLLKSKPVALQSPVSVSSPKHAKITLPWFKCGALHSKDVWNFGWSNFKLYSLFVSSHTLVNYESKQNK